MVPATIFAVRRWGRVHSFSLESFKSFSITLRVVREIMRHQDMSSVQQLQINCHNGHDNVILPFVDWLVGEAGHLNFANIQSPGLYMLPNLQHVQHVAIAFERINLDAVANGLQNLLEVQTLDIRVGEYPSGNMWTGLSLDLSRSFKLRHLALAAVVPTKVVLPKVCAVHFLAEDIATAQTNVWKATTQNPFADHLPVSKAALLTVSRHIAKILRNPSMLHMPLAELTLHIGRIGEKGAPMEPSGGVAFVTKLTLICSSDMHLMLPRRFAWEQLELRTLHGELDIQYGDLARFVHRLPIFTICYRRISAGSLLPWLTDYPRSLGISVQTNLRAAPPHTFVVEIRVGQTNLNNLNSLKQRLAGVDKWS